MIAENHSVADDPLSSVKFLFPNEKQPMFVYRNGNTDPPKDVLLQVVIDPSVTYIKVCAFEECRSLTSVTIILWEK